MCVGQGVGWTYGECYICFLITWLFEDSDIISGLYGVGVK